MRLDLYQIETAQIAKEQGAILEEVRLHLISGNTLSRLEQNGVLHALQVLVENAIGKAKQILKASGEQVPLSAYDAFAELSRKKKIPEEDLVNWNSIIGLRNRIVHEYMNIDITRVLELVQEGKHQFLIAFLLSAIKQ